MKYYAFLDEDNTVIQVIEGPDEGEIQDGISDWEKAFSETYGAPCKRVDIETHKNYAAVGYVFDTERNAFIPPKPFESCIFNEETCQWEPPTPMPAEGGPWMWVEADLNWQLIPTE